MDNSLTLCQKRPTYYQFGARRIDTQKPGLPLSPMELTAILPTRSMLTHSIQNLHKKIRKMTDRRRYQTTAILEL